MFVPSAPCCSASNLFIVPRPQQTFVIESYNIIMLGNYQIELENNKPTKSHECPAKTQISLHWLESSLYKTEQPHDKTNKMACAPSEDSY